MVIEVSKHFQLLSLVQQKVFCKAQVAQIIFVYKQCSCLFCPPLYSQEIPLLKDIVIICLNISASHWTLSLNSEYF